MPEFLDQPVAIAGAGAVAQALGRLLVDRGARVTAVGSRDRTHALQAAGFIGGGALATTYSDLPWYARHILVAVSDRAIETVAGELAAAGLDDGVAVHTCGALGPEVLAALARQDVSCGLLHPLQTVTGGEQGVRDIPGCRFAVAGDAPAVEWAEWVVRLAGGVPLRIREESLSAYHAAAVMAGNYIVGLLDAAVILMRNAGVDEREALDALAPLARASLENTLAAGPAKALTGPIARGDAATVRAHLRAAEKAWPGVARLYRGAGLHVLELARRGSSAPEAALREIRDMLLETGDANE